MTTDAELDRARELFEQRAWGDAYEVLRAVDVEAQLGAVDLERLAVASYLTGHDDDACDTWARAHRAHLQVDDGLAAVRCAFWIGCVLILTGQLAPAHGWFARTQHLLDSRQCVPVATGYLDMAAGLTMLFSGDPVAAYPRLEAAASAGLNHAEPDLAALSRLGCGQALIMMGRPGDGVAMLDEAMVAVSAGEVSPVATGLIYCAVIDACQGLFDLRRAREWTAALGDWCGTQPDLVPYRGQCLVHRAQLMRINGAWADAFAEAEQASQRLSEPLHPALGAALYEQAELYRLRGDDQLAGDAYRRASDSGHGVQPGLALLRLRQGRVGSAAAAIERTLAEPQFPAQRARLLAAHVEIQLAAGDAGAARAATNELAALTEQLGSPPMLAGLSNDAAGLVLRAERDSWAALRALRQAWSSWQEVDAPYEAARTRLRIGLVCRDVGDEETALMEFEAALQTFASLGAAPDVAAAEALLQKARAPGGLTSREVEVLALVATGSTNRAIAQQLVISEKTVARHVSNIFTKLGLSSRSAATAYAYEHNLV